jgi:hypothetical protein
MEKIHLDREKSRSGRINLPEIFWVGANVTLSTQPAGMAFRSLECLGTISTDEVATGREPETLGLPETGRILIHGRLGIRDRGVRGDRNSRPLPLGRDLPTLRWGLGGRKPLVTIKVPMAGSALPNGDLFDHSILLRIRFEGGWGHVGVTGSRSGDGPVVDRLGLDSGPIIRCARLFIPGIHPGEVDTLTKEIADTIPQVVGYVGKVTKASPRSGFLVGLGGRDGSGPGEAAGSEGIVAEERIVPGSDLQKGNGALVTGWVDMRHTWAAG